VQSTKGRTRKKGKSSIKRRKSRAKNMKTENCIALRSMLCFFRLPYQRLKSVRVDRKSGGAQAGYWQNLVQIAKCCRPTGPGRILRILVACSTRKKKMKNTMQPKDFKTARVAVVGGSMRVVATEIGCMFQGNRPLPHECCSKLLKPLQTTPIKLNPFRPNKFDPASSSSQLVWHPQHLVAG